MKAAGNFLKEALIPSVRPLKEEIELSKWIYFPKTILKIIQTNYYNHTINNYIYNQNMLLTIKV